MSKTFSVRTAIRERNFRQICVLILLGIVFLLAAWLVHPDPFAYPLGLFLFGAGMLVGALIYPYRLVISGIMVTLIGAVIYLTYRRLISGADSAGLLFLAISLGLFLVALMARRGYVGKGAITPALLVFAVGLVYYAPTDRLLPSNLAYVILSLWFPGLALLVLGLIYWFIDRGKAASL